MLKPFSIALFLFLASSSVFAASPRTNYLLYCSGCHGTTGVGSPPNVPTLVDELGRMMTVPEMRGYLVRIPGASQAPIEDAELTDVINWVLEEMNKDTLPDNFRKFSLSEVAEARKNVLADPLKYRIQFWKDYEN